MRPDLHFDLGGNTGEHSAIGNIQHNLNGDIMDNHARVIGDISSLGVVITTLLGLLPPIAALASLIWTGIQIYDWYKKKKGG